MRTIKGPAIFLAQFAGDAAPFNSLDGIGKWAAGLGFVGVQIPSWDGRLFDLDKAALSKAYCDDVKATLAKHGGRDDAPAFLAAYQRKGIFDMDPFVTIDQKGVGELIATAIERGRIANPALKIGICGEHAGDATSLSFFAKLGIDYVSCSPYRVPVARLALAQAAN